jgi:hypothetical protein
MAARARRQGESIGGRSAGLGRDMAGSGRFEANPSASTPAPAQQQQDLGNTKGKESLSPWLEQLTFLTTQ